MTSTLPPPAPPTPTPATTADSSARSDPSPSRSPRPARAHLLLTELSLWLLTLAAVFGFCRIFSSWAFFAPLAAVATIGHLTASVCRRRHLGLLASSAISAVLWVLVTTWLFFVETTFALLPTPDTISSARDSLDSSWSAFREIIAPAPALTGFLLASSVAIGIGCFLADWAAFRLWSAREALVASVTLFVFATLLADGRYRTVSAVLEISAALLFVLLHRILTLERSEGWVDDGRTRAGWAVLRAGVAVGVMAVVVGALIAPTLPGADKEPLVDWRRGDEENGTRTLDNPLVDLRNRIVDTSDTKLFTVESTVRSYWRIAGLDQFDGATWELSAQVDEDADGRLSTAQDIQDGGPPATQRVTLQQLRTEWLPAAFRATDFRLVSGPEVEFDKETSTFIAKDQAGANTTYEVTSTITNASPDQLRRATVTVPGSVGAQLELPDDFSSLATQIAADVTEGAATPYDRAIALQEFFQSTGGFTYSIDAQAPRTPSAIDDFLNARVGYCEQFAGAFAAMARSLDIPARVAVGYTWGEPDPSDPDRYQVLGRNAHAWPEVYLGQYGWVGFEPTPGRGNPTAVSYTDVPPAQDDPTAAESTTTTTAAETSASTSTTFANELESAAPGSTPTSSPERGTRSSLLGVALVLVGAAGLYLLAVPGSLALRRHRRRARAGASASAHVGVAWSEAVDWLAGAGMTARPDETHTELARRAHEAVPPAGPPMQELARLADAAAYGPEASPHDGDAAEALAAEVHVAVDGAIGRSGRVRRFLDPRPLWNARRRRHVTG